MTAAAAADYFATKKSRWFMAAWLGAFAFNRTGRGADSIAAAEGLLQAGWHVVLFPEGTRTMTGEINPFSRGSGCSRATPAARSSPCASSASGRCSPRAAGGRTGTRWR